MARYLLAAVLTACLLTAAEAQQPLSVSEPATEEVVVTGSRTEEAVRAFVNRMDIGHDDQLARWDRKICPGVAGLRTRYAQFLIDRIAQRALNVDLDIGDPGCRSNVLIIVTPDPDVVAQELAERHPRAMGVLNERGSRSLGRSALAGFVASDAPVRWWHVSHNVTRDGEVLRDAMQTDFFSPTGNAPVVTLSGNSSRLEATKRRDFGSAFIIVDARRLQEINFDWGALADYLAMVSLAQLDPSADAQGVPTVLNLFAPPTSRFPRPTAMTEWDTAYLRGLYSATRDARSTQQQEGEIASSMHRDLTGQAAEQPPQQ